MHISPKTRDVLLFKRKKTGLAYLMIKSASFLDMKFPIPGGVQVRTRQAHSRDVRKGIQTRRRNTGLQPEVYLLEMSEAHFHT